MCLPLLIFSCTVKSRSSLLVPAHPGGHGKRAIKWLWLWCGAKALNRDERNLYLLHCDKKFAVLTDMP